MRKKAYRDSYVAAHLSNTIAAQISAMRETRGWTQTQLAEKAGMKQSRISNLEDPNYENIEAATLRRIASAFDVGLTIRFAPFSEVVDWAASISDEKMDVPDFDHDALPHYGTSSAVSIAVTQFEALNANRSIVCGDSAWNFESKISAIGRATSPLYLSQSTVPLNAFMVTNVISHPTMLSMDLTNG